MVPEYPLNWGVSHLREDANLVRPLVGISVVVVKNDKPGVIPLLLLGKRKGSHGTGEYACPGGHLKSLESFEACARREVMEETGLTVGPLHFLRVLNTTHYAPKHYVDLAFAAEWVSGEPEVREPDKVERWDWYDLYDLPSPLFATLPSVIQILIRHRNSTCDYCSFYCQDLS